MGFWALVLSRLSEPSGSVAAIEPHPQVVERLTRNIELNDSQIRLIRVESCAVGNIDGTVRFSLSLSETQVRFEGLPHVKPGHSIDVESKRLDTYILQGNSVPDVILMDVEHAEGYVLEGMTQVLEIYHPLLVIEMHGPEAIAQAWRELQTHSYDLMRIDTSTRIASQDEITYGHYFAAPASYFAKSNSVLTLISTEGLASPVRLDKHV